MMMTRLQPRTPTYPHLQPHRLHRPQPGPRSPQGSRPGAAALAPPATPPAPPQRPAQQPAAPDACTGTGISSGTSISTSTPSGLGEWQHLLLTAALGFAVSLCTGLIAGLLWTSN